MNTISERTPAWPPSLQGMTVVVTGGFGALGGALGRALLDAGAQVALLDKAAEPSAAWSARALPLGKVDLCDAQMTQRALQIAADRFGRLDALVNVAGGFQWEPVATGSVDTWSHLFDMNLRTALIASQAILPSLLSQRAGRIVNVGSLGAAHAELGMGAYAASKAAVARLTEAMAAECKGHGITVNAVLPGVIDTPGNRQAMPDVDHANWIDPAELAQVVMFLLSDAAAGVNGALIPVRGRA